MEYLVFKAPPEWYTFALAIVEGKPMFAGDVLYTKFTGVRVVVRYSVRSTNYIKIEGPKGEEFLVEDFSWNPPNPKTVMIELTREDVEYLINQQYVLSTHMLVVKDACRKALEESE